MADKEQALMQKIDDLFKGQDLTSPEVLRARATAYQNRFALALHELGLDKLMPTVTTTEVEVILHFPILGAHFGDKVLCQLEDLAEKVRSAEVQIHQNTSFDI